MENPLEYETIVVRDDNTVLYKGNGYSVPITFCQPGDEVGLTEEEGKLIIFDTTNRIVAKHRVSTRRRVSVKNNNHYRDYSENIPDLYRRVLGLLNNTSNAERFLVSVRQNCCRHIRDELYAIEKVARQYPLPMVERAIDLCLQENIYKAVYLKNWLKSKSDNGSNVKEQAIVSSIEIFVELRDLDYYEKFINGGKKDDK